MPCPLILQAVWADLSSDQSFIDDIRGTLGGRVGHSWPTESSGTELQSIETELGVVQGAVHGDRAEGGRSR